MSFQNYENFQGQPPAEGEGAPGGQGGQQPQQQMGQPMENSGGQFQGGNMGGPGSAGGEPPSSDNKTTLWYVHTISSSLLQVHSEGPGRAESCPALSLWASGPASNLLTSKRRMGELEPWIDENFVRSIWFGMGEQVSVKMIRDKFSG